jgi:hypothetical protein
MKVCLTRIVKNLLTGGETKISIWCKDNEKEILKAKEILKEFKEE